MTTESHQRTGVCVFVGIVLAVCGSCSDRVAPVTTSGEASLTTAQNERESSTPTGERTTREDHFVIETVLLDLLSNEKLFTFMRHESGTDIVLDAKTGGESFYLRLNQIRGELDEGQLIPDDLGNELWRRNKDAVSLEGFNPDHPNILARDLTELPDGTDFSEAFAEKFPNAKAYVEAWLPAYSKDGTTALLRFWFGPTPHGAAGTYMLIKEDGQWKVLWRSLAYYA